MGAPPTSGSDLLLRGRGISRSDRIVDVGACFGFVCDEGGGTCPGRMDRNLVEQLGLGAARRAD